MISFIKNTLRRFANSISKFFTFLQESNKDLKSRMITRGRERKEKE